MTISKDTCREQDVVSEEEHDRRRPVMVRVPPPMLERIDHAARRLGLSRAAFMLSCTAQVVERMEGRQL